MKWTKLVLVAFIGILLSSCTKEEAFILPVDCDNAMEAVVLDYTGLDGCGLVLSIDGEVKEPINLQEFGSFEDGDKLWLKYESAENMASICMVGEMIELTCVTERD